MATFTDEAITKLEDELRSVQKRRDNLFLALYPLELRNPQARRILEQGVMRRISLLSRATIELFDILPPTFVGIPPKATIDLATLLIQANIVNTYGLLDCWAHVWALEFDVRCKKNKPLRNENIGIGKTKRQFRNSLTGGLRELIELREPWIQQLSSYRHSLAHRIPLYIPPNMVDPKNADEYNRLQTAWYLSLDRKERQDLKEKMDNLSHFKAMIAYDLDEDDPVFFHPQLLINFITVEELSMRFLHEIREKHKRTLSV